MNSISITIQAKVACMQRKGGCSAQHEGGHEGGLGGQWVEEEGS